MQVGDYVRTENGIDKVEGYRYDPEYENGHVVWFKKRNNGCRFTDKDLPKSSSNIIDLIEVGDFVTYKNGNYYFNIPTRVCGLFDELTLSIVKMVEDNFLNEVEITSIVTKEQFEDMEYKVGVDKE